MHAGENCVVKVFEILQWALSSILGCALTESCLDARDFVGVGLNRTWVELTTVQASVKSA